MNCNPSVSSVQGVLQARILEWVDISISRGSSWPRDWTWVSHIAGRFFTVGTNLLYYLPSEKQASLIQTDQNREEGEGKGKGEKWREKEGKGIEKEAEVESERERKETETGVETEER